MWKNVMSIQFMVLGFEPRPLEHESLPITTRPGLPVPTYNFYNNLMWNNIDLVSSAGIQTKNLLIMSIFP